MEISDIAEIIRKEKSSNFLQELGENFHAELGELVERVFSSYPEYSRERENLKKLISELINVREKKLVNIALSIVREKKRSKNSVGDIENITEYEKKALNEIIAALEKNRRAFESIFSGKREITEKNMPEAGKFEKEHKSETKKEQKKQKMLAIRMLADLPPIFGIDKKVYGPFKKEDVVFMPEKNAKIFIDKKYAVEIK